MSYREFGPFMEPRFHQTISLERLDEAAYAKYDSVGNLFNRLFGRGISFEDCLLEVGILFGLHTKDHMELDAAITKFEGLPEGSPSKGSMQINVMKARKHLKEREGRLPRSLRE